MESSSSVLPNQQKTYSKAERSSFCMREVMPWEKGVRITMGIVGWLFLMPRAMSKMLLLPVPGIQMMRFTPVRAMVASASSLEAT